jgi:hypothetical protein
MLSNDVSSVNDMAKGSRSFELGRLPEFFTFMPSDVAADKPLRWYFSRPIEGRMRYPKTRYPKTMVHLCVSVSCKLSSHSFNLLSGS